MRALLDDLVDFNRTRLGLGLKVTTSEIDLESTVFDELEQLRGAHPDRQIEMEAAGQTRGSWDGPRLQQLLRNLVTDAIDYGSADAPVRVTVRGAEAELSIEVTNHGLTIDSAALAGIFDPLRRGHAQGNAGRTDGLGLGLFIVREIAAAHGGHVEVRSGAGATTFTARLPRRCGRPAAPRA